MADLSLTDGLAAYGDATDPLIPVGELTRLLEMDVDVMPAERRAIGRLGQERRSLIIDVANHFARDGAKTIPISDQDVVVGPGDLYLKASAFQKIFPLKFAIDAEGLSIKLTATELLPVQERLTRLARRREESGGADVNDALEIKNPYGILSPPGADVTLGFGLQGNLPHFPLNYDIHAGADLLGANFQGYVGSDQAGRLSNGRLLLERRSVEGNLLGPVHARVVGVGDVFSPSLPLGARSVNGIGIAFSTVPLDNTNVFNRIDLRGELPTGYDAELYVNDVLRGGQNTPVKGRYEFLNVPLSPGINVIRIVMYGPRGERQESTSIINVGAGLLNAGQSSLEFAALKQNDQILRFQQAGDSTSGISAANLNRGVRVVGSLNYGLTSWLTTSLGAAWYPRSDGTRMGLFTGGARSSVLGLAVQADAAGDTTGGEALDVGVAGRVLGASAVLRHSEYRNNFGEENATGADQTRALQSRTELTMDDSLNLRGRIIPISTRALRNGYADGSNDVTLGSRVSSALFGVLWSSDLAYTRTSYRNASPSQTLTGYLAASTFQNYKWQIRATIDYQLLPVLRGTSVSVIVDRRINALWSLRFGAGAPLDNLKASNITVSNIFHSPLGDISLVGGYDNGSHSWNVATQLSFGLAFDPLGPSYHLTRAGPGGGGTAVLRAFVDANGDGVYEPGEEPVPNVRVDAGGQKFTTGQNGRVLVTGLGPGPTARLTIGTDDIQDSSLKPPGPTVRVTTRPGSVSIIPYPLQRVGTVVIKVQLRRADGQVVPLSAARLRLLRDKSSKVIEAATEFDGSAIVDDVPPGDYRIELDPDQAAALRMHLNSALSVTVAADGKPTPDVIAEVTFDPRADEKKEDSEPSIK